MAFPKSNTLSLNLSFQKSALWKHKDQKSWQHRRQTQSQTFNSCLFSNNSNNLSNLALKNRCSRSLTVASLDDKSSSNSRHTKLVRVESAWAANPVSNLKSHWTAPEDTAHGVACRTSRIASRRDLLNDDVESEEVLWPAAFLEDKGWYKFHNF